MPSSTSRPGSFERRVRWAALITIIGAPLMWLTAEQAGYVLAYQACDSESRSWVTLPTLAMTVLVSAMCAATYAIERRARSTPEPQRFLAWMSIGVAAMIVVVMLASSVGPLLLRPCD